MTGCCALELYLVVAKSSENLPISVACDMLVTLYSWIKYKARFYTYSNKVLLLLKSIYIVCFCVVKVTVVLCNVLF